VVAVSPPVGTVLQVPGAVPREPEQVGHRDQRRTLADGQPDRAVDTLRILGIGVARMDTVFRFGRDQGLVVEQDPPADSLVRRGAGVTLSVGRESDR